MVSDVHGSELRSNPKEMYGKVELQYNRARQARLSLRMSLRGFGSMMNIPPLKLGELQQIWGWINTY